MYGMTPMGAFFTAIFPLKINEHALCQQLQSVQKSGKEQGQHRETVLALFVSPRDNGEFVRVSPSMREEAVYAKSKCRFCH